jgi:PTS system nitrogen regulatory IIA component
VQLTVRDVARLLNVSEKTVYRWLKDGRLPAYRVHDQYRFNRAELLEWATARKVGTSAEVFREPESVQTPLPGLQEALRQGGIFYRVSGHDKESVIRNMVETMRLPEEVDRQFLVQVLLARESLGSTGVGDGIAIPHVRNPIVLHVNKPMITLCFLERPIDFESLDGRPVFALFSLVSPNVRSHLHLLSRLAHGLRDGGFKDAVVRQASRDEILVEAGRVDEAISASAPRHPTA